MTQTVTFDDVRKMFQDMVLEDRARSLELDRKMQETARQMLETDRKVQETARQMLETDRKVQETARQMLETDRKMQETARQMLETDRKVKEVTTQIGRLGGRWGEFVEGLIAPSCIAMFSERGILVDEIYPRVKKVIAGESMEIDLLVANTVEAVLVEVKSRLRVKDVRTQLKHLKAFKTFFPRYAHCQVYGAVAGIAMDAGADQFAMNQGLFVIVQAGDTAKLANQLAFKPRIW